MEEVTDSISDNHVKVYGKMHLLISCRPESKDILYQMLEDVYNNFTSIHKAFVALLDDLKIKDPSYSILYLFTNETGFLITFCRFKLKRIFEEDGITINRSLADLLVEIEFHLLDIIQKCADGNDSAWDLFNCMEDMMERIGKAYFVPSPVCYQLIINYDLMMEFVDQCQQNLECFCIDEDIQTPIENCMALRNHLQFTKDQFHGKDLEKMLIAVENVAYEIERYVFCVKYTRNFERDILSRFRFGVLKALVMQPDGFSNRAPLMSDELLIGFVKYVQEYILELLEDKAFDWTDTMKGQLMNLHEKLSFLMNFAVADEHSSKRETLSNIRLDFQALASNVRSVICSFLENPQIEEMSFNLFDLIEKCDVMKGEIIKTICYMVIQETELESSKTDQLRSLILLLQKLKELVDSENGLILSWKDHDNLVLFVFYLVQDRISIGDGEFSRNTLQLDVALINHEELNGVLISAQILALDMAIYSSFRRYGRFRWWELYFGTKEHINMFMCVGILNAIALSSTVPLTYELLIAYGECVQDSLVELVKDEDFNPLMDQFNFLYEGLLFLQHFLTSYKDEQEKLSHINVGFQDLVRSIGSFICWHFNNRLNGYATTKQSTRKLSGLVKGMQLVINETVELLDLLHINKIGRESPKTNQLGSLNLLLQSWNGLMECESDLIITWKDQFQIIYENLVSFQSSIENCSTEAQSLCSSIVDAAHAVEYLLTTFAVGTCPLRCRDHWISELIKHVERTNASVMEVKKKRGNVKEIGTVGKELRQVSARKEPKSTDVVIGFDEEVKLIKEQLSSDFPWLDVVSIIGMPGLGKTTLARKVYEDHDTVTRFTVRAWCSVSQEYNKKELFLTILGSIIEITDEIKGKDVSDISTMVYQELKGRRYLIVLDDIWRKRAFVELSRYFPDDKKGSRIMLTSRRNKIGELAKCHSDPVKPKILTDNESWDLMKHILYGKGECPLGLQNTGIEIAKKCSRLPLAVVVIAGILANSDGKKEFWVKVGENLSLYLARDSQSQFLAALELSYDYLPDKLKPMFLYLGAFPEDAEIPTDKLMRLWAAEGFVQKTGSTSLESQAEENLMDLIDRSLVMVVERRSDGRVKTCHLHDLLRDMCLAKSKDEKFMHQIVVNSDLAAPVMYQHRLSIFLERNDETTRRHFFAYQDLPTFSITPPIYSIMFFQMGQVDFRLRGVKDIAPVISSLKLLKSLMLRALLLVMKIYLRT